ncbi:MAG: light-harvesting protein [Sphingomonadaceae bacterium]|nr:light-harvesting protein [Sphingomonadaceae bacterium]
MIDKDDGIGVRTYLTAEEAKDFHKLFTLSFAFFTLIAVVAHFLVWEWRPWLHSDAPKATTTASVVVSVPATHS